MRKILLCGRWWWACDEHLDDVVVVERERDRKIRNVNVFLSAVFFFFGERSERASAPRDEEVLTEVAAALLENSVSEREEPQRRGAPRESWVVVVGGGCWMSTRTGAPKSTPAGCRLNVAPALHIGRLALATSNRRTPTPPTSPHFPHFLHGGKSATDVS